MKKSEFFSCRVSSVAEWLFRLNGIIITTTIIIIIIMTLVPNNKSILIEF